MVFKDVFAQEGAIIDGGRLGKQKNKMNRILGGRNKYKVIKFEHIAEEQASFFPML